MHVSREFNVRHAGHRISLVSLILFKVNIELSFLVNRAERRILLQIAMKCDYYRSAYPRSMTYAQTDDPRVQNWLAMVVDRHSVYS